MNPTTTPTKNAKGRITGRQFEPKAEMVVPERISAPKPIIKAAAKARAAVAVYEQACAEVKAAEAAVKEAPLHDERADVEAVEAGAEMPERTEPARRRELTEANRLRTARRSAAIAALGEQGDAITDNHEEFMAMLKAERSERRNRVDELAGEARTVFYELRLANDAIDAASHFNGYAATFSLRNPDPAEREARANERAAARLEKTQESGQRGLVPYDARSLTAALVKLAKEQDS